MISKHDHIRRQTDASHSILDVVRLSLFDNAEHIPLTDWGGYISTELGENDVDESIKISIHGFLDETGEMMQTISVICFDTFEKARSFLDSPEGEVFDDKFSDGKGCFYYTTKAENPILPVLITDILKKYFGFRDDSRLVAETHCEVDYFSTK